MPISFITQNIGAVWLGREGSTGEYSRLMCINITRAENCTINILWMWVNREKASRALSPGAYTKSKAESLPKASTGPQEPENAGVPVTRRATGV